jgi:hypothetical protein
LRSSVSATLRSFADASGRRGSPGRGDRPRRRRGRRRRLDEHFPLDVFQTGSGTSTNMNANEVIANRAPSCSAASRRAKQPVHPNDHVNAGQSSNDVIPTAIHVAAYAAIAEDLEPALEPARRRRSSEGGGVRRREDRPHAPAGRHADALGPGVLRLRGSRSRRRRRGSPRSRGGWPSWRSAAPPSAPASTRPPASPTRSSPAPRAPAIRSASAEPLRGAGRASDAAVEASGAL